jgi:two-component system nitrate/nitrite response regulator NarL
MLSNESQKRDLIHVFVGDNSRIHCHLLAKALERDPSLRVVGSASNWNDFMAMTSQARLDIVIISANLEDDPGGGITMLGEFHQAHPRIPAIVLVDSPKRETVLDAFRAGAHGIFDKHESLEDLRKCLHKVHEGQVWADSRELKFALEALSTVPTIRAVNADGLSLLSRRELQVVRCLAEGLTNREIGARLGLSQHTIKNYLIEVFKKLGVSNRVELFSLAVSHPAQLMRSTEKIDPNKG